MEEELKIVDVTSHNLDQEHICCAIGDDKTNCQRADIKKAWMKERFAEGHTFKKFDVRGKVFIEYAPAETAWFPVDAPEYMLIQCLWVSGRYQGLGLSRQLIEACEQDSRARGKKGLVVVSTAKKQAFMVEKKFYLHHGFEVCDKAAPNFELLVKKFDASAPNPSFRPQTKEGKIENIEGLVFFYSDMCPFVPAYVDEMMQAGEEHGLKVQKIKIESLAMAKEQPCPFGIFSVYHNGNYLTQELMTKKKFGTLLQKS